ncbi:putative plasmodium falciparum CPW-WPC domain-containing protein [Neospora caninum Liverpool]|uniref:Plasmodium falciparum CPW-WPC domain-containing protein, putative n=1 Tax=Neospora caninum (strain Liverpool) TaxID=572307 RepID=F0VB30_NEOCL|nr:putative plasmodium falciparum CPW-WPC domain-containing protein [Neospora caninum Liverpool]CBZ50852.1 putative plasmodium falciparum CPW-WPC domain-containing protein [Neospora caninum Liverpool]CEL68154.1 TPA: plasmodium falciparum CPW-WPC domain-containing protein, putative [Neospora caninum Liverpool]|eukprot:XP_003880885.1 putative plasmodium falciparum CPW-WPC domain-containing protein [Neospora caninum Liverpool]
MSFPFPVPQPGLTAPELIEPQSPRMSRQIVEATKEDNANRAEIELEAAADEATGKLQEALDIGEPPHSPEEKETKAREKSGFLTNILEKAAQAFSSSSLTQLEGGEEVRQFQRGVIAALEKQTLPSPMTKADFDELEEAAAPKLVPECVRDYSLQCPEAFRSDGANCVALDSYKGPCAKIQTDLHKLTEDQKVAWSDICQASFPCLPDSCPVGSNYKRQCPVGWKLDADGSCRSASGKPPCDNKIRGDSSAEEKANFESTCHVRWPCLPRRCSKDYSTACPEGWHQSSNRMCSPPPLYKGPCNQAVDMSGYVGRSDLKASFEKRCLATWPCNWAVATRQRDYEAPCPLSWIRLTDRTCEAPPDFQPSADCPRRINSAMSASEKASLAVECDVDFPFAERGQCPRDFSSRCPIDWVDVGDGHNCRAPEDYMGNCDRVLNFGRMSDSQKVDKMAVCTVDWPCVGEWTRGATLVHFSTTTKSPSPPSTAEPNGALNESGVVETPLTQ